MPNPVVDNTIQATQMAAPAGAQAVQAAGAGLGAPVHDLSLLSLFLNAHWIVQAVMVILILASIWSWAVIIDKILKTRDLKKQADEFERTFWAGGSLDDLYDRIGKRPSHPMALLFAAAMHEWKRSTGKGKGGDSFSLQSRLNQVNGITIDREMDRIERGMGFLATVASSGPFIGLFGTVVGIMNSFTAIAATKNTSLAVVAPGIAEALFATAIGLVAAIPAAVAYNKFSTDIGRYAGRLEGFAGELTAMLSRKLEERGSSTYAG